MNTIKRIATCIFLIVVPIALGTGCNLKKQELPLADWPNILIIMVDDLNDNIGIIGGHAQAKTPHMEAFTKTAATFTRAYTAAPMCGPSRAHIFTGIYPHNSNNYFQNPWCNYGVLNNFRTLMEQFKEARFNVMGSVVVENLGKDPVADRILFNLIDYLTKEH